MTSGYIAAVLSKNAARKLRAFAVHPVVHCHHITIAHQPSRSVFRKYAALIGKRVPFTATKLYQDECGQAVAVVGMPSENEFPHITISCAGGVPAAYSNRLLAKRLRGKPIGITGFATVMFVSEDD